MWRRAALAGVLALLVAGIVAFTVALLVARVVALVGLFALPNRIDALGRHTLKPWVSQPILGDFSEAIINQSKIDLMITGNIEPVMVTSTAPERVQQRNVHNLMAHQKY